MKTNKIYAISGDQKKASYLIEVIDAFLGFDGAIQVATATKIARKNIAESTPDEIKSIYSAVSKSGGVNTLLNNQETVMELDLYGTSKMTISSKRASGSLEGKFVDKVITVYEFDNNFTDFSDCKVVSEMIESVEGKYEQIRFYNPDGSLFASKSYEMGSMDLSISEIGWSQMALADITTNTYSDPGIKTPFGTLFSKRLVDDYPSMLADLNGYTELTSVALSDYGLYVNKSDKMLSTFKLSKLMNPTYLRFYKNIVPSRLDETPFNIKTNDKIFFPQVSTSSKLEQYASGLTFDFEIGQTGKKGLNSNLKMSFDAISQKIKIDVNKGFEGEFCTYDLPNTPIPDKLCGSMRIDGSASITLQYYDKELSVRELIASKSEAAVGMKYVTGYPEIGCGASTGISLSASRLKDSDTMQLQMKGDAQIECFGGKAHIEKDFVTTEISLPVNKDTPEKEEEEEEEKENLRKPNPEKEPEDPELERKPDKLPGCEVNPYFSDKPAKIPTDLDVPAEEYKAPKTKLEPCGTLPEKDPNEIPKSDGIDNDRQGCGNEVEADTEEVLKRLAEIKMTTDPMNGSKPGWCGTTSKLTEAVSAFSSKSEGSLPNISIPLDNVLADSGFGNKITFTRL